MCPSDIPDRLPDDEEHRHWLQESIACVAKSKLMDATEGCSVSITNALRESGQPMLDRLLTAVDMWMPGQSLAVLNLANADAATVQHLAATLGTEGFSSLIRWAQETGDDMLALQVSFASRFSMVVCSMAKCELTIRNVHSSTQMTTRRVSNMQVASIRELRATFNEFETLVKANLPRFEKPQEYSQQYHMQGLGERFDVCHLHSDVTREVERILKCHGDSWSQDLRTLSETIFECCPKWTLHRESLCSNAEMKAALLANKHYGTLAPVSQELRSQIQMVKQVQPPLVEASLTKRANYMVDLGVETVAFTYFISKTKKFADEVKNLPQAKAAVEALKCELTKTKVKLTDEMTTLLDDWMSGAKLGEASTAQLAPSAAAPQEAPPQEEAEPHQMQIEQPERPDAKRALGGSLASKLKGAKRLKKD